MNKKILSTKLQRQNMEEQKKIHQKRVSLSTNERQQQKSCFITSHLKENNLTTLNMKIEVKVSYHLRYLNYKIEKFETKMQKKEK